MKNNGTTGGLYEPTCNKDEFLRYIDGRLDELKKDEPDIRPWFRYEFKKRFPEIVESEKNDGETKGKNAGTKADKNSILRQQIADIKEALTAMGIKTWVFKKNQKNEVNADATIEQQVSKIQDTLYAVGIRMDLLEERRKEQVPIGFACRRHSNNE